MEYTIKNRWNGQSIFKADAESFKDVVLLAIKGGADLSSADLSSANLGGVDLSSVDLSSADLSSANLSGADLSSVDLGGANLSGANLSGADLSSAYLSGAKEIPVLTSCELSIVPEQGQFVGWKKCKYNVIVKVIIGRNAKRSNATGRKCRAEYVKVLEVFGAEVGISQHDSATEYRVGKIVRCDKWNEDRWTECGGGIHFFLTRTEAEKY